MCFDGTSYVVFGVTIAESCSFTHCLYIQLSCFVQTKQLVPKKDQAEVFAGMQCEWSILGYMELECM